VFIGQAADMAVPPVRDPRSGRVRQDWLVPETDPASAGALALALRLKGRHPSTQVTAVHLGGPGAESWLRCFLAQGVNRAVRIWDDTVAGARAGGKAVIAAACAEVLGFELILAGTVGVINAAGQFGSLLASHLSLPCVTQVLEVQVGSDSGELEAERVLAGGFRERVAVKLPAVLTVLPEAGREEGETGLGDDGRVGLAGSAGARLAAQAADIPVWSLADLGVPEAWVRRADKRLKYGQPRPVRPRFRPLAAPDPSLPAFDRILKLLEGRVERREGRLVRGSPEDIAQEIFQVLLAEGWLDHLRSSGADTGQSVSEGLTGHPPPGT